jgi:hypothetical protein
MLVQLWMRNEVYSQIGEKIEYFHCKHGLGCLRQAQTAVLSTDAEADLAISLASSTIPLATLFLLSSN